MSHKEEHSGHSSKSDDEQHSKDNSDERLEEYSDDDKSSRKDENSEHVHETKHVSESNVTEEEYSLWYKHAVLLISAFLIYAFLLMLDTTYGVTKYILLVSGIGLFSYWLFVLMK